MSDELVKQKLRDMFSLQTTPECYQIPQRLKGSLSEMAYNVFLIPVQENEQETPESKRFYASKIQHPMALQNLERNLNANLYPTIGSLFRHLYQIVQNSYLYNNCMPKYLDAPERTPIQYLTNEFLEEVNRILYFLLPDSQKYVREESFALVFQVLSEFKTASNTQSTSRYTVEQTLEYVRDIRRLFREMPEATQQDALDGIRELLDDASPTLYLALYPTRLKEIRDKLKTGYFVAKKLK